MSGVDGTVLEVGSWRGAEGNQAAALVGISLGSAGSCRPAISC